MDESEWLGEGMQGRVFGDHVYAERKCPAWYQEQPLILELSEAYDAYDKGELTTVFPNPANIVVEGAQLLTSVVNQKQARDLRKKT